MLHQLQPKGLCSCSISGSGWQFSPPFSALCVFVFLSFSPPPFVCDCVIVQFAHSSAVMDCPSPEQLPDSPALPPKETIRANKKTNNAGREISKSIQGNVLLQRQEQGPPGAHYCSQWDKERGSCSMDPRRRRNQKGRVGGSGTRNAVLIFLNSELYICIIDTEITLGLPMDSQLVSYSLSQTVEETPRQSKWESGV